jgi:hypothetical protein
VNRSDYSRYQRTIANAIRVAIWRECVSLDLDINDVETKRLILDALRQVSQVYTIEIDLEVDPRLAESDSFPKEST